VQDLANHLSLLEVANLNELQLSYIWLRSSPSFKFSAGGGI